MTTLIGKKDVKNATFLTVVVVELAITGEKSACFFVGEGGN